MYRSALREAVAPSLARAAALESPYGLISRAAELPLAPGEPAYSIWTGLLGDLSQSLASQRTWNHRAESGNIDGAGGAIDAASGPAACEDAARLRPPSQSCKISAMRHPRARWPDQRPLRA